MGTTRIKIVDLSSGEKEIKTSRKHAEKLTGAAKLKEGSKDTEGTKDLEDKKPSQPSQSSQPSKPSIPSQPSKPSQSSKPATKTIQKHHLGKKYKEVSALVDKTKLYSAKEALELLPKTSLVKFDATVETHINVSDRKIRGTVNLPHPIKEKTKKEKRYLVFSDKQLTIEGKQIIWADEKTIPEISGGNLKPGRDFDVVYATPKFMPQLTIIAKILGPAGMMPNPKNQTVVEDITATLSKQEEPTGTQFQADPTAPIVHLKIGKLSNKPQDIAENLKAITVAIGPTKIKKLTLTTTMGPGIKIDLSTITSLQ